MEGKNETTSNGLKELGNAAVKNNKFEEAILHYTHAIKQEPDNYVLYSNRSFAFLKLQQYSLAMEDANETIRLNQSWAKGYFRKGEIEFATYNFSAAQISYEMALKYKPDDGKLIEAIEKARRANLSDLQADAQVPWVGAGVGIVIGVIIAIADYIFTATPTHPLIMAFATIAIALSGYGFARVLRYYVKSHRNTLLQTLYDDEDELPTSENIKESKTSPRYTKSQARQRFKKGKM